MQSIIERINKGDFWDFHGGIHPPEQKFLTKTKPIRPLSLPKQLIIPLQQHIGREGDLLVKEGDTVLKGQPLTLSTNPMVVPIHAPTSGTIAAIKPAVIAHPSALKQLCVFLDVDGKDTWRERVPCSDIESLSKHQIIEKIADAGVAGMGGAGFPTHIKANSKPDINFLIINAAECEPYITSDDLLMMEHSEAIVDGIKILDKLLTPAFILIGVEDNKPKAIKALQKATEHIEKIRVCVIPTKYPSGGEKQLIKVLTGQEIPSGSLPLSAGIVMHNVGTCFAINEAVRFDTPLIRRVVTITGQGLQKPQNVWALLGTPIDFLLTQCGLEALENELQPVIMGGPMMGFSISSNAVPIVKTTNCILVPNKKEMPSAFEHSSQEVECIRCGECSDVCPSQLLPQELQWSAKAKDYPQLEKLNLSDCIDCGACAYVCPSQIPLVHYYRIAKSEIREQQQLDLKAEKAKLRFEARKLRLEKEKIARQEKHKKAAEARKAAMNKATPEAASAKSAVAAALARVKAKKSGKPAPDATDVSSETNTQQATSTEEVSPVAAAIARAKAKKLAKEQAKEQASKPVSEQASEQASEQKQTLPAKEEQIKENDAPAEVDDKKAKVAAAVAKAKEKAKAKAAAKKAASEASNDTDESSAKITANNTDTAEAINAQETNQPVAATTSTESAPAVDDKKAKVAAAVAKAKEKAKAKAAAKKAAKLQSSNETNEST